ncbi:hypothetical protein OG883_42600 [Streptomyces sp. NBC_01142]|uniref:hypothetical protein n=1 Tax=Streptomyces sp. NBC_01142 TaxID=2975865 RepID=UPI00224DBA50|nr:hypothetical protein [Streptomyces sp. NBC_01142]MCX4826334.1 hypothetical protein [Streptomyces sp. NBC_01142]
MPLKHHTHARCLKTHTLNLRTLVCHKSPEHIHDKNPVVREHYDPSAEERWSDTPDA